MQKHDGMAPSCLHIMQIETFASTLKIAGRGVGAFNFLPSVPSDSASDDGGGNSSGDQMGAWKHRVSVRLVAVGPTAGSQF